MDSQRSAQIITFLQTVDRLKSVYRASYLTEDDRHENDAEHTAHMAIFALLLAGAAGTTPDLARVLELTLVHDLPEVFAGDTWAYDLPGRVAAHDREAQAARELFGLLPDDLNRRFEDTWREFEDGSTPEAVFVRAVDRLQGFAQNVFSGGRSYRERGVTEEMTRARNDSIAEVDGALASVYEALLDRARGMDLWTQEPDGKEVS